MSTHRTRRSLAGIFAIALALGLGACSNEEGADQPQAATEQTTAVEDDHHDPDHSSQQEASLADWEGTWVSLSEIATQDNMRPYAEEAAQEHGETIDQVLEEVDEARATDFAGMVVSADKIAFVDEMSDVESASADDGGDYTFSAAEVATSGDHEFTWFVFEGGEGAKYKYVLLMPLHGEESLAHYHMRYGDDLDSLLNPDNDAWFPTMVNPDEATDEQLGEVIFHHHH